MSVSHAENDTAVKQVTDYLLREKKGKFRVSKGEQWIDHYCLFHEDGNQRGASFQPDTHAYACRHGGKYTWDDVMAKTGAVHRIGYGPSSGDPADARREGERAAARLLPPAPPTNGATRVTFTGQSRKAVPPAATGRAADEGTSSPQTLALPERQRYTYYFPETDEVSHHMERLDYENGHKEFKWLHADGKTYGRPDNMHPVYGDTKIEKDSYIIVVEGEKCVDAVYAVDDRLDGPIVAVTWPNGASAAERYSSDLAQRISDLDPALVILWPDNDTPGLLAMNKISTALKSQGLTYVRIKPKEWGFPDKYDVADYLAANKSLAEIITASKEQLPTAGVDAFVNNLIVTQEEMMVYPNTRRLWPIKPEYVEALWQKIYGKLPKPVQTKDAVSKLRQKSAETPTAIAYRTVTDEAGFYWRPSPLGQCWRVTAAGITKADDPPGLMLLTHATVPLFTTDVDETAGHQDFLDWCECFRLTPLDTAVVEAWLVSALCGLQTPIMMCRGQAGSGKTTFARALVGVIEPIVLELDATKDKSRDEREFVRIMKMAPAAVMDNVSTLSYSMEDTLSKLVTGFTATLRTLYTDHVELFRLQKAVVLTTVTYDVFKSDLSSRIVVASPSIGEETARYKSDRYMMELMNAYIPKIRGHIFKRCVQFYQEAHKHRSEAQEFRVGDLGWVLRALGYPVDELAKLEGRAKSLIINQNDPWLDAIVTYWQNTFEKGGYGFVSTTILCKGLRDIMYDAGVEESEMPKPASRKFSRYMSEKRQIFRDFGFDVDNVRTEAQRGYHFQALT